MEIINHIFIKSILEYIVIFIEGFKHLIIQIIQS